MPSVIVDVNILVSGIGPVSEESPPVRTVRALSVGQIPLLISPAVFEEYNDVLWRPRLREWHGLRNRELGAFLRSLRRGAKQIIPDRSAAVSPDPGDQHLWDLLAAEPEAVLVTGDRKLLESSDFPGRILPPREFVERYLPA